MKKIISLLLIIILISSYGPSVPATELEQNVASLETFQSNEILFVSNADSYLPIVAGGVQHLCMERSDGGVKCWGSNWWGQHGIGAALESATTYPVETATLGNNRYVIDIASGSDHTCAVLDNYDMKCWGSGSGGKLGTGSSSTSLLPTLVTFNTPYSMDFAKVSVNDRNTCAVLTNGSAACWGDGNNNLFPSGNTVAMHPELIDSFGQAGNATQISVGYNFACVLLDTGNVSCWGNNDYGQIGDGTTTDRSSPTAINSLNLNSSAISVGAGSHHACTLLSNGSVLCWGQGSSGKLGSGSTQNIPNPTFVSDFGLNRTAIDLSVSQSGACVVLNDSTISCWGNNAQGRLGDGSFTDSTTPVNLQNFTHGLKVKRVFTTSESTCAMFDDASMRCWGQNVLGQLGDGTITNRNLPGNYSTSVVTPQIRENVVEDQFVSLKLTGVALDDVNSSNVNITIEVPQGMVFQSSNMTLYGTPLYSIKSEWNVSISSNNSTQNGIYKLRILADTDGDSIPNIEDLDDDGDSIPDVVDVCPTEFGNSTQDVIGCPDQDGDGFSNNGDIFPKDLTQWKDTDSDGYGDNLTGTRGDNCPDAYGESTRNNTYGCPDTDFDGWADSQDHFPNESSQWKDSDGDGYGDEFNGLEGDDCIDTQGTSYLDRFGCSDADSDGVSDKNDAFPNNPSQTNDRDGDGYGDNQSDDATQIDRFPSDTTQWDDTDGDGYGDNQNGNLPDRFPNDPSRWQDSDQDGVADEDDSFPDDATQDTDSDGDGYGDNAAGNRGDTFPNDAEEWSDTDGDGIGNNADAFPFDPSQQIDSDGDGFGDDERGSGADKFPSDSTQWSDIDGDGYGDNAEGTNPDAFIADPTQWSDSDGDGYGDNPTGRLADAFTEDPTQWIDEDGDGLGDNQSGTNADPSLNDFDNDGYNDSIDPLPKLASPGDLDNDGVLDVNDQFPEDAREWADYDGDGEGDNADTDDDNDGWADTDEVRLGTDPFSSADVPVDSFEIVIPGTAVGLGAWDLIGMFGGIPLFMWIGFGFVTRNGRTAKYEALLREAQTRDELEGVARKWEYSLMLRMLGPHQGIRLERLRAELDDVFEAQNQKLSSIEPQEHDQTQMVEQAMQEEQKSLPSIESSPPEITAQGNPDGKGYEWYTDGQETSWYRNEGSNSEWQRFEA